jgi:hypothetical protein
MGRHFVKVESWGGWFGNLFWLNSDTIPNHYVRTGDVAVFWGGFEFGHVPFPKYEILAAAE